MIRFFVATLSCLLVLGSSMGFAQQGQAPAKSPEAQLEEIQKAIEEQGANWTAGMNDIFPQFVFGADARDEAALARLVAKVQAEVPADVAKFVPVDLPEGIKAVQVVARTPYSMHFAGHKGHFFLASSAKLLSEALTRWGAEGSRSLVRDDPILPLVLKSAIGGDTGNLAALGYVNFRR